VPLAPVTTIREADPLATVGAKLAKWAGFTVVPDDVANVRLLGLTILPQLAGWCWC
jgi:hypothetical protein